MALRSGISYDDFFQMTPFAIKAQIEAFYDNKKSEWKRTEYLAWLTGHFITYSIGTNLSKKVKYPENPIEPKKIVVEDMELTEEEKEKYRQELFEKLKSSLRSR